MSQASLKSFMRSIAPLCGVWKYVVNLRASSSFSTTEMSAGIWNTPPPQSSRSRSTKPV
jgi:hypothetical protein